MKKIYIVFMMILTTNLFSYNIIYNYNSGRVERVSYQDNSNTTIKSISYQYDNNGNILSINAQGYATTNFSETNAAPDSALSGILYDEDNFDNVDPGQNLVQVYPSENIKIQPVLTVPEKFSDKTGTLILYICTMDLNCISFTKDKKLEETVVFDNIPFLYDFSPLENLKFQVWYGIYIDGDIYFNAYEVEIMEKN